MIFKLFIFVGLGYTACLLGQEPGRGFLDAAYQHLQDARLGEARVAFEAALKVNPDQANARLDYGYLLLRMGETEQGRNEIKRVLLLRPGDERLSLEYAFLAYETGQKAEAFEVFLRLTLAKDEGIRRQASETWVRLDRELKASIARWTEVSNRAQANAADDNRPRPHLVQSSSKRCLRRSNRPTYQVQKKYATACAGRATHCGRPYRKSARHAGQAGHAPGRRRHG